MPTVKVFEGVRAITYPESGSQRIHAFVVGQDERLYVNWWNGQQWAWANQGTPPNATVRGIPGAITYPEGGSQRIHAFVIGSDGHLYVNWWNGQQWAWADQGTPPNTAVGSSPGAITYPEGGSQRIHAFVAGQDERLYVNWWNGQQWAWADQGTP